MKFCQVLLVFWAACQVHGTARYGNSLVLNSYAVGRGTERHSVHKRQTIDVNQCLRCENIIVAQQCSNGGEIQELTNLAL